MSARMLRMAYVPSASGRMRPRRHPDSLDLVENETAARLRRSGYGIRVYGGTLLWLALCLTVGWLPLLWFNGWNPPNFWSAALLVTLSTVVGGATAGWWFHLGWCFAFTPRLRRNAIVLAALVGGVGIVIESGIQLNGAFGANGGAEPEIGDVLAAPLAPAFVAVPLLIVMGLGFYIHAIRVSRE